LNISDRKKDGPRRYSILNVSMEGSCVGLSKPRSIFMRKAVISEYEPETVLHEVEDVTTTAYEE
jgi:hypothetical protein